MYRINDLNHIINSTCMFKTQERVSEKRGSVLHSSGSQEVSVHIKRDQNKGKAKRYMKKRNCFLSMQNTLLYCISNVTVQI